MYVKACLHCCIGDEFSCFTKPFGWMPFGGWEWCRSEKGGWWHDKRVGDDKAEAGELRINGAFRMRSI